MAKLSAKELKSRIVEGKCEQAVEMVAERLADAPAPDQEPILQRLGDVVKEAFDDFAYAHVDRFIALSVVRLGEAAGEIFQECVNQCRKLTQTWQHKLLPLEMERHARGLREAVRARDVNSAVRILRLMIEGRAQDPAYGRRLNYVGAILGSLSNDQQQAHQLFQRARSLAGRSAEWSAEDIDKIEAACQDRAGKLGQEGSINLEREFRSALTQVTVEMRQYLPGPNVISDVPTSQARQFSGVIRAIIRTGMQARRPIPWADICEMFVEFVPARVSATSALGGVEGRLIQHLGPAAQNLVKTVFKQTGELEVVRTALVHYAESIVDPREFGRAAETMRLMAHPELSQYLKTKLGDKRLQKVRPLLMDAIGQTGDSDSVKTLIEDLRRSIRKATLQGEDRRQALKTLQTLGQTVQNAGDVEQVRSIVQSAISLAPDKDPRLKLQFALQITPPNPAETLTADQRNWLIATFVQALWLGEETPENATGPERQRTLLGWREPVVDALEQFGQVGVSAVIRTAEDLILRYSPALMALAEYATRVKNQALTPLLERALDTVAGHNSAHTSRYAQETYWDATLNQRKPITQKMALAAVIHALGALGGRRADMALTRLNQRIQSNQCPTPDADAYKVLYDAVNRTGALKGQSLADATAGADDADMGLDNLDAPTRNVSPAEVQAHIAALGKFYLFAAKKRTRKVAAIQALAMARAPEALDALLKAYLDSDAFISASAAIALQEYASAAVPPATRKAFLLACLDQIEEGSPADRNKLVELLQQCKAGDQQEMALIVANRMEKAADGSAQHRALFRILKPDGAKPIKAAAGEGESLDSQVDATISKIDLLARRQEYLKLRQAWVRGGKKGAEPPRPPGV